MKKIRRCSSVIFLFALALSFSKPLPSAAMLTTNSFTGSASVPDLVAFTTTDDLNDVRIFHTTTLLNNGMVLVAGGYGPPSLFSAELYNSITETWNTTGSMQIARRGHTATLLNNGKVLVVGGLDVGALASAELYDPDTGIWSTTGSINVSRYYHTATLLNNGKVLIAGGYDGNSLTSTELYDPDTGTWSIVGNMNGARHFHTATLLENGKVVVAGGSNTYLTYTTGAELFDPVTNDWSITGSMSGARFYHTATLLHNGKVLVAGTGYLSPSGINTAELYDPIYGTWTTAGDLNFLRVNHTATLLSNGKVLVVGGAESGTIYASAELYNPVTDIWETIGSLIGKRCCHNAILLNSGKVLATGGLDRSVHYLKSSELGTILFYANTFTSTLTLPSDWINNTTISAQFIGTSSSAAVNAAALSNDNIIWGNWIPATSGEIVTTSWDIVSEGANKLVYLSLRDINSQVATVVNGTVNVDLTNPLSAMTLLPPASPTNIPLSWSGSDSLSGVATYDVQVREGPAGAWTDVLVDTINTSVNFVGVKGVTYYFRTRTSDLAGNLEDWPSDYDTFTIVEPIFNRIVFLPIIQN